MKLQNNQKTENRLKVCPEKVHHENYVKFPNTNKTGKLLVLIKASFCIKSIRHYNI